MEGDKAKAETKSETEALVSASPIEGLVLPIWPQIEWQNFIQWARSVRLFLQGKGKEGYITGDAKKPENDNPNIQKWQLENGLIMLWLLNTMMNEICENFMYYDWAKEIWDAVKETYLNVDNTSIIFKIKSLLDNLRQGESTVTNYFNSLNRHWQQLDIYEEVAWKCTGDKKLYNELVKKDRLYKFLIGLNQELNEVRGRILGTKPLPHIREVFSEVRREESRRKLMLGTPNSATYGENSAMVVRSDQASPSQKKNRPWCEH